MLMISKRRHLLPYDKSDKPSIIIIIIIIRPLRVQGPTYGYI